MNQQRNGITRGRKLTERNKHQIYEKQTKQKDEKKYKLISVRKRKTNDAKTNNRKNATLGSYTRFNESLNLQISSLVGWFKKINACLVFSICFTLS